MRFRSILVFIAALSCAHSSPRKAKDAVYFVAGDGDDHFSGRIPATNSARTDGPFRTLDGARDALRRLRAAGARPSGAVRVEIRGGEYSRTQPFVLDAEDGGTANAPITYAAYAGESVHVTGGAHIRSIELLRDDAVLQRIPENARGHVMVADLRANGVTDFGQMQVDRLEVFEGNQPLTLARWPNEGFVKIVDTPGDAPFDIRGAKGNKVGKITYEGERPANWSQEKDPWVHGYWFWDWADQRQRIQSIDTAHHVLTLAPPDHKFGYRAGQYFYAYNLLSELDRPGEWYLDHDTGHLYVWPLKTGGTDIVVSVAPQLLQMSNASYVTFDGITFEATRGTAISVIAGEHDRITRCTIRNVGEWGARFSGGSASSLEDCEVTTTGDGGVDVSGGDRATLRASNHAIVRNRIHGIARWDRTLQPAVHIQGVGVRVAQNLIYDTPHIAIWFEGNDHVIELNEIHDVCLETDDAGAIYAGRDWTMRGTTIRYNLLHHITGRIGRFSAGVYLDDMFSGTEIRGNIFYKVTRAVLIGGGRDNVVTGNIFLNCEPAIFFDARALSWAAPAVGTVMAARLHAVPYAQAPWNVRYPALARLMSEQPPEPRGNTFSRNVFWQGHRDYIEPAAHPFIALEGNGNVDEDPRIVDIEHHDFRLREDSPLLRDRFDVIPVDQIGPSAGHPQ